MLCLRQLLELLCVARGLHYYPTVEVSAPNYSLEDDETLVEDQNRGNRGTQQGPVRLTALCSQAATSGSATGTGSNRPR
jgi:hypothetical protein